MLYIFVRNPPHRIFKNLIFVFFFISFRIDIASQLKPMPISYTTSSSSSINMQIELEPLAVAVITLELS